MGVHIFWAMKYIFMVCLVFYHCPIFLGLQAKPYTLRETVGFCTICVTRELEVGKLGSLRGRRL